jgi:hypothetical protein
MATFLSNRSVWALLSSLSGSEHKVRAAISYVGKDGAKLLKLGVGDELVVDLSLGAVRQGVTNPFVIREMIRNGVRVFTRSSLHTKFLISGRTLIVGSANASRNSRDVLDEAALVTTDPAAVRRALSFFRSITSEPVRGEYLKECLKSYRPPTFKASRESTAAASRRRAPDDSVKLWFVGGLRYIEFSEKEKPLVERAERNVRKNLALNASHVETTRYFGRPKLLRKMRRGQWIVQCVRDDSGRREVTAPAQILDIQTIRPEGERVRSLLLHEAPDGGQSFTLGAFRRRICTRLPFLNKEKPQTRPIPQQDDADAVLRLWTTTGRIRKSRSRQR